jgi:hypothetical protein
VVDGTDPISCSPASGSTFPMGNTTVNCTAVDNAGNRGNASFNVTVSPGTTVPTISGLSNITDNAANSSGAIETYAPTATDEYGAPVNVACVPASGSLFPVGVTGVNCSATDIYGNTATASFTVTELAAPGISTCAQLQNMTANLTGSYVLANDINCSGFDYGDGGGFMPVGSDSAPFTGTFNGSNHTVTGLYMNRPSMIQVGLFGHATNASVSDVGLVDVNVTGNIAVGGLIGESESSKVSGSYSTGKAGGILGVGGLIGWSQHGSTSDSYSAADVSGQYYTGGLIGDSETSNVSSSYSTGSVGGSFGVGGLIGWSQYGTTSNSYSAGNVSGQYYAGGLIGYSSSSTVSGSYWDIHLSGQGSCIGLGPQTGCQGEDSDGTNASYFYNASNAPMSSWDFTSTWYAHPDTYPTQRAFN